MDQREHLSENLRRLRLDAAVGGSPSGPSIDEQNDRFRRELEEKVEDAVYESMQVVRRKLPIYDKATEICSKIAARHNQVIVLSGETGCGKSTQVPQFILDDFIRKGMGAECHIICTQPRRISTISLAHRVAEERAERCGGENSSVGYKIRHDELRPREHGSILYCTTGIILQRLKSDPLLNSVSHLLLDEIHERDLDYELMLIIMKEILPERPNLKLILMSATLRAELFSVYYNNCPMFNIPGVIHPVKEYHVEDIVDMIGFNPDMSFSPKSRKSGVRPFEDWVSQLNPASYSDHVKRVVKWLWKDDNINIPLVKDLIRYISMNLDDGAILVFMPGWDPISKLQTSMMKEQLFKTDSFVIHIMHSGLMSTEDLQKAFEVPKPGVRKVIIATNVAETSLTINDVVYVIDCGKVNLKTYDVRKNLSKLEPVPNSKANATQRKGRAGRLQPGVCFYLYTSYEHGRLKDYHEPEILRIRLEELCLKVKLLRPDTKIVPFLENAMKAPPLSTVKKSIELLYKLNALEGAATEEERLTPLGVQLAQMPVNPQIGKMLVFAASFNCLEPILTVAACIDYKVPCYVPPDEKEQSKAMQKRIELAGETGSDHLMFVNAYNGWCEAKKNGNSKEFCYEFYLSPSILKELKKRRAQFKDILCEQGFVDDTDDPEVNDNSLNENLLRAMLCTGLYPNVAIIRTRVIDVNGEHYYNVITHGDEVKLGKRSVKCDKGIPHPFIVYYLMMKSFGMVYIYDCTGISLNPLIFFGGDLEIKAPTEDGNLKMSIDNWTQFETTRQQALELMNLRKDMWSVLSRKCLNPAPTDWDESGDEGRIMNKILRLITDDVSVTTNNEWDGAPEVGLYHGEGIRNRRH